MSFLFGGGGSSPAPTPLPPAPVQIARQTAPEGDAGEPEKRRLRRRGLATILTGEETVLGATQGKTLLGA